MSTPAIRTAYKHRCQSCGHNTFAIARRGAHVGAWCAACGRWLKWLNSKERDALALPDDLPEYDDAQYSNRGLFAEGGAA
jgi:hypothetical protein